MDSGGLNMDRLTTGLGMWDFDSFYQCWFWMLLKGT